MSARRIFAVLAGLLLAPFVLAFLGLWLAHRQIDAIAPALPSAAAIVALRAEPQGPIRVSYINTASQEMPRSGVIEASLDPRPDAPYAMSHAAFVLEWADGRIFLIDAGMDAESALAFGAPLELAAGAEGIVPLRTVADALGDAVDRVDGIAFTHLHRDHTQGIAGLCRARPPTSRLPVFETALQAKELNYTTRPGRALVSAAACAERRTLDDAALQPIPGFPGLAVFAVGGHTPGSQVFAAWVGGAEATGYLFVGDIVNHIEALRNDWPKPHLYSLLLVPESGEQLTRARQGLRTLESELGARVLTAHDQLDLEASGVVQFAR